MTVAIIFHPVSPNVVILHNYGTFVKTKKLHYYSAIKWTTGLIQILPVFPLTSFHCCRIQARILCHVQIFTFMFLVPRTVTGKCLICSWLREQTGANNWSSVVRHLASGGSWVAPSTWQVIAHFCHNSFNRVVGAAACFSGLRSEWEKETVSVQNWKAAY
jgi:hypothetical protein